MLGAAASKPLFGVCVGMQMLLDHKAPRADTPVWGLILAKWVKFDLAGRTQPDGSRFKVPQMGWNQIPRPPQRGAVSTRCGPGIPDNSIYFVHSFYARPQSAAHCAGEETTVELPAAVAAITFSAQFHP